LIVELLFVDGIKADPDHGEQLDENSEQRKSVCVGEDSLPIRVAQTEILPVEQSTVDESIEDEC
jgi:hypothetical protein